jgi:hypothetical protein
VKIIAAADVVVTNGTIKGFASGIQMEGGTSSPSHLRITASTRLRAVPT